MYWYSIFSPLCTPLYQLARPSSRGRMPQKAPTKHASKKRIKRTIPRRTPREAGSDNISPTTFDHQGPPEAGESNRPHSRSRLGGAHRGYLNCRSTTLFVVTLVIDIGSS